MACSCVKNRKNINQNNLNEFPTIQPFQTCLYCAYKHLSYALILIETTNQNLRAIGEIYLAFKHVEKSYLDSIGISIFQILKDFFKNKQIDLKMLKITISKIQDLIDKNLENEEIYISNYEQKNFNSTQLCFLYLICAYELLFFQTGYEYINKPYAIGLLQRAAENTITPQRLKIRNFWKQFQKQIYSDKELFSYIQHIYSLINKN